MTPRQAITKDWTRLLTSSPIGIGLDIGTTKKKTSNPSALVVTQPTGNGYAQRLVVSWKTNNEEITKAIFRLVLQDIKDHNRQAKRACLDASNEVFFAQGCRKEFIIYCPIDLVKGGETIEKNGEKYNYKTYLGNLYATQFEDGLMLIPDEKWLQDDHRRVLRDGGSFNTELGPNGEHGDTFDAGKLSLWALLQGGRSEAAAVPVGGINASTVTRVLLNPFAHLFNRPPKMNV